MKTYISPDYKPVYNIDNAVTPAFVDFLCKKYVYIDHKPNHNSNAQCNNVCLIRGDIE